MKPGPPKAPRTAIPSGGCCLRLGPGLLRTEPRICDTLVGMAKKPGNDPILLRFRAALGEIYGERVERVVLYGSRARGEARPDSDYDVAVFLKTLPDRWEELDRLAALRVRFLDETGAFFDARPYPAGAIAERSPLMHEIREDGVEL